MICVEPNLLAKAIPIHIQIRIWKTQQTKLGVVEQQFDINDRCFGFLTRKIFDVEDFWLSMFSVHVSMPPFINSDG